LNQTKTGMSKKTSRNTTAIKDTIRESKPIRSRVRANRTTKSQDSTKTRTLTTKIETEKKLIILTENTTVPSTKNTPNKTMEEHTQSHPKKDTLRKEAPNLVKARNMILGNTGRDVIAEMFLTVILNPTKQKTPDSIRKSSTINHHRNTTKNENHISKRIDSTVKIENIAITINHHTITNENNLAIEMIHVIRTNLAIKKNLAIRMNPD